MKQHFDVVVLGAGNFGTCLAQHLGSQGNKVAIYAREQKIVDSINQSHINPVYLSSITLSKNVSAFHLIDNLKDIDADAYLIVIPTQFMREVLNQAKEFINPNSLLIAANKGIEISSQKLPLHIIEDTLGKEAAERAVFLSGPSFAIEVAEKQPTAVCVASHSMESCLKAQELFHDPLFRTYTAQDPIGLEISGALKNIMAIAAGACDGLGFQQNSRAALLTRALAEITRIGVKFGAEPITFQGLGGVGDLFLTCSSSKSRNYSVGYRLGKGESIEDITASMVSVAEGIPTTKAAKNIVDKLGIDAPIINQVYAVLYEKKPIKDAVIDLITRQAKAEFS